jgi:hypothetical protein
LTNRCGPVSLNGVQTTQETRLACARGHGFAVYRKT